MLQLPPIDTVRGRIKHWLMAQRLDLQGPVLEVGTAGIPQWWTEHRDIRADLEWRGLDQVPGQRVDIVADASCMPEVGDDSFGSALCCEVLEHAWRPAAVLFELARVVRPGGLILVTVPFAFPYHQFPDDYWRISHTALARMMREAGMHEVTVEQAGHSDVDVQDHDHHTTRMTLYQHTFGRARA